MIWFLMRFMLLKNKNRVIVIISIGDCYCSICNCIYWRYCNTWNKIIDCGLLWNYFFFLCWYLQFLWLILCTLNCWEFQWFLVLSVLLINMDAPVGDVGVFWYFFGIVLSIYVIVNRAIINAVGNGIVVFGIVAGDWHYWISQLYF